MFPTRSDKNRAVQPQKTARDLKFWIQEVDGLHFVAKTKVLISGAGSNCAADLCLCFRIWKKQVFS